MHIYVYTQVYTHITLPFLYLCLFIFFSLSLPPFAERSNSIIDYEVFRFPSIAPSIHAYMHTHACIQSLFAGSTSALQFLGWSQLVQNTSPDAIGAAHPV